MNQQQDEELIGLRKGKSFSQRLKIGSISDGVKEGNKQREEENGPSMRCLHHLHLTQRWFFVAKNLRMWIIEYRMLLDKNPFLSDTYYVAINSELQNTIRKKGGNEYKRIRGKKMKMRVAE